MFGQNAVAKKMQHADGSLLVNEIWYTLQGEGPDAGRPAVFVRLSKCNLRCYFCDTDFERGERLDVEVVLARIKSIAGNKCDLVVITGGEPLLQNIVPLVRELNAIRMQVAVETAGTVYVEGLDLLFRRDRSWSGNIIVCSPKTPVINADVEAIIGAWKYIVRVGETSPVDGLPMRSTQTYGHPVKIARPRTRTFAPIYVQAQDEGDAALTQANLEHAAGLAMTYGMRLSVQTHKIAGVP
jgi:7-carboxy-7-deazaguanine synthase